MLTIKPASSFKQDFKRTAAGNNWSALITDLPTILYLLTNNQALPKQYNDHPLTGNWNEYRECHIKPDLLLIYQKSEGILKLARLGTHSELFKS
jgi:mRNA interferase YafQ